MRLDVRRSVCLLGNEVADGEGGETDQADVGVLQEDGVVGLWWG